MKNKIDQETVFKNRQQEFFDAWAKEKTDDYEIENGHPFDVFFTYYSQKILFDWVEKFVNDKKIKKVLDCGCGHGKFSFAIKKERLDISVVGIDISAARIKEAKKRSKKFALPVQLETGDCENLRFKSNTFNAAIVINLLHHSADFKVLEEIKRVLKKGGKILIVDLVANNPIINLGLKIWKISPSFIKKKTIDLTVEGTAPERRPFHAEDLKIFLEQNQLKIVHEKRAHLFVFVIDWMRRIFPSIRILFPVWFLKWLWQKEKQLLSSNGKKFGHIVYFECEKK